MSTAGLELHDVAATPGGVPVLADVDLTVPAGTCTAVLGPSGSGKTTLLRVVAGLEPAAGGRVLVGGRDVTDVAAHRRPVGVVFQEPRLFPHRTVRDNVTFGLEVAGVGRDQRAARADALLARVGLDGLGQRSIEGLSGGEQQRVNLARALAVEPEVLLLDEPLSSVDPERRDDLLAVLAQATAGLTRVHVTHDRAEAAQVGDRVAALLDGRVVQHAPARDLFERPMTTAVARLVGATVLTGEVHDGHLQLGSDVRLPVTGPVGPAAFALRPDAVHVGDGPVRATVRSATYRGTGLRLELELGEGATVAADVPVHTDAAVGATIAVTLPHLHRLDDGARP